MHHVRIAPLYIVGWMKHGYSLPWIEKLTEREGGLEGIRDEKFFAREIMMKGSTLATMFDEFNLPTVISSATVVRLMRSVFILEESIYMGKEKLNV